MDELDELGNPSVSNEILENLNDSQKEAVYVRSKGKGF